MSNRPAQWLASVFLLLTVLASWVLFYKMGRADELLTQQQNGWSLIKERLPRDPVSSRSPLRDDLEERTKPLPALRESITAMKQTVNRIINREPIEADDLVLLMDAIVIASSVKGVADKTDINPHVETESPPPAKRNRS